ncbi:MAG: glycosyltransferase family 4 protein [Candidatus Thorarchaeota archaeon]
MKILITFTFGVSLDQWYNSGIIYRELELYKKLLKKNVKIIFLTYGDDRDLKYSNILGDINIFPAQKYIKSKSRLFQLLKSLLIPFKLKKLFKQIDIIKTNQMEGSLIACLGKLLYRKKLIIRCGYEWLKFYILENKIKKRNFFKYWARYFYIYITELISYKLADSIILTSPIDIDFIIKVFRLNKKQKKIKLLYNYIDSDLFKPLNLLKKEKSVIYIGRLNEQKNLFNLLEAFKDLKDFTLDIIGDGELKEKLMLKANKLKLNVNFLGLFPNNKIPEILNQHEFFILPSYYEGNPKALLEAMSCGLICIGTNVWGIKNLIEHEENGLLCKPNASSIKQTILKYYKDGTLRKKIQQNARNFILDNASLNSIAEKEYRIYKDCTS